MAVFIIGVTFVSLFEEEQDVRMSPGQTIEMAGYTFRFDGVRKVQGANYLADQGTIMILQDGEEVTADQWAEHLDTISYEVVCQIGPRLPRRYLP